MMLLRSSSKAMTTMASWVLSIWKPVRIAGGSDLISISQPRDWKMDSMASRAWVEVFFITGNHSIWGGTSAGVPRGD